MLDREPRELPWGEIRADLLSLAYAEAARLRLPREVAEDAAQEALTKLLELGRHRLPQILVGPSRGRWLRPVARNRLRAMMRADRRRDNAQRKLAATRDEHHIPALSEVDESLDPTGLPESEWRIVTFVRAGLSIAQIAELERIGPAEVERRARWAALRLRLAVGRRPPHLGLKPGSLARRRGAQRRAIAWMLLRNGWSIAETAVEFGTSAKSIQVTLARGVDRAELRTS